MAALRRALLMPGSNAGTGQPNYFACAKHRFAKNGARYWGNTSELAARHVVTLTGRRRPRKGGGIRMTHFYREYECSCGHVGWSAHIDLEHREAKQFGKKSA